MRWFDRLGRLHNCLPDGVASVTPYLVAKTSRCESARLDRVPAEFAHQLGEAPGGARASGAMWDFKDVKDGLGADPLDGFVRLLTPQGFKAEVPGVGTPCKCLGSRLSQQFTERHQVPPDILCADAVAKFQCLGRVYSLAPQ